VVARARGVGGVFKAGLQSFGGGEITAFTSEIRKAKVEAVERAIEEAKKLGANAIIGLDMETSSIGQTNVTLVSATRAHSRPHGRLHQQA
jgi:uncharacterized protein YbjQ (UPF0145 family)